MITNIKSISIPEPCHQSWQQMTPNDNGRHCEHCCKTVVDFTTMSNEQIIAWMSAKTNVCGRFYTGQIEAVNKTVYHQKRRSPWKTLVAGIALAFILQQNKATGQTIAHPVKVRSMNIPTGDTRISNANRPAVRDSLYGASLKAAQIKQDILTKDLPHQHEASSHMWQVTGLNTVIGGIIADVGIKRPARYNRIWYQINSMYWNVYLPIISANTPSFNE